MQTHAAAELFPLIEGADFERLVADIAERGLLESLTVTPDGQLLDGRNRSRACAMLPLGITPTWRTYDGDDPLGYVLSVNLHRRHLNESQRAMVAAKLANLRQGARTDLELSANLQNISQAGAATMLSVSTRSVAAVSRIHNTGPAEVIAAVQHGRLVVS